MDTHATADKVYDWVLKGGRLSRIGKGALIVAGALLLDGVRPGLGGQLLTKTFTPTGVDLEL